MILEDTLPLKLDETAHSRLHVDLRAKDQLQSRRTYQFQAKDFTSTYVNPILMFILLLLKPT